MSQDLKLAEDEARRHAEHEKVKKHVGDEVRAEIEDGADLKRKAIGEVGETEREIRRARVFARIRQVVDFVFYVVYALIGIEIVLELIGARERAGFKHVMNTITAPLLGPFRDLVSDPSIGRFQFMASWVVALLAYLLVHVAIRALIRLFAQRRTSL